MVFKCVENFEQLSSKNNSSDTLKMEFSPTLKANVLPNVEVLHIDILVGSGLPLAPQEETLLRRGLCNEGKDGSRGEGIEEKREAEARGEKGVVYQGIK